GECARHHRPGKSGGVSLLSETAGEPGFHCQCRVEADAILAAVAAGKGAGAAAIGAESSPAAAWGISGRAQPGDAAYLRRQWNGGIRLAARRNRVRAAAEPEGDSAAHSRCPSRQRLQD